MAKIKIRIDNAEVEIDSRDFYLDNQSVGKIISEISRHLINNSSKSRTTLYKETKPVKSKLDYLDSLNEAEIHEPEFNNPISIDNSQIKSKLLILANDSFFDKPRTVSETVGQLREYGWISNALDVAKILTQMTLCRELNKKYQNNRNYYLIKENSFAI